MIVLGTARLGTLRPRTPPCVIVQRAGGQTPGRQCSQRSLPPTTRAHTKHTDYWTALALQYGYEENATFDPDRRKRSILAFVDAMSTDLLRDLAQMEPPNEHPQLLQQLATALRQGSDEPYARTASSICPCGVLHIFLNHDEMEQGMAEVRAKKDANDAVLRSMQEETPQYHAELHEVQRRRAEQKRILADLEEQEIILAEGENERKRKIAEMERIFAERQKSRAEQLRLRAEEDRITGERSAAWATRIKRLEAWNAALAAQLREMSAEKAASAAGAADREVEAVRVRLERQQLDAPAYQP